MERKKFFTTKTIAGLGILTSLVIVLQFMANYIYILPNVSLNLSLVPIVVGALFYGPLGGAFLGLVDGVIVLFAPGTMAYFWPFSQYGTILTCLFKTLIAGALAGVIFIPFKMKHEKIGVVVSAISCPIINTGLFVGCVFLFFYNLVLQQAQQTYSGDVWAYIAFGMIGINFIIELVVNSVLSIGIYQLYLHYKRKKELSN